MHHREEENMLAPNLVNQPVWESLEAVSTAVPDENRPSMRMRQNLIDASINFGRKLLAQSRLLVIVISDRLFDFSSSTFGEAVAAHFCASRRSLRISAPSMSSSSPDSIAA